MGSKSTTLDTRVADWLGHCGASFKRGRSGGDIHSFSQQRPRYIYRSFIVFRSASSRGFIKRLDFLKQPESQLDLCYNYGFSKKLEACDIHSDLSPQHRSCSYSYLQLAVMAMSQQSLPPVNQYTGSYTEDTEGDEVRLNAFGHEDANIAYDPLSANRRFAGTADLAVLGTLVFAGPTRETISVMVPDCLVPPENDAVRVDLRHHVGHPPSDMSTPGFPRPVCIEMSDTPTHNFAGPRQEGRPTHRPAAPIQRFNSKSIGWPAWFRHFRAVADVQGWDKDQRALQMVSYLDEKAMNVAQELSDRELYNYDALVGLLSARFDPASRVSASRSRFHGRTRRHQEDADTYADSITELCRLGYPQSSPELRQELISEQFVRGQSDPELKKYLWVVIRTQKDKKLQTLIEVCTDFCTDFASLSHTTSVHRPAEQVFALEEEEDREEEMFAVVDRQQWNTQRAAEPPLSPELQQMFALAGRIGYEMRPIARRFDAPRQAPGPRLSQNKDYRAPFRPRDYSRTKCFSCGQLGHTQVRCPKPDSSFPFRPSGWVDRSDGPQRGSGGPPQGNEI